MAALVPVEDRDAVKPDKVRAEPSSFEARATVARLLERIEMLSTNLNSQMEAINKKLGPDADPALAAGKGDGGEGLANESAAGEEAGLNSPALSGNQE